MLKVYNGEGSYNIMIKMEKTITYKGEKYALRETQMADVEIMLEQMKIVYKNEDHVREEKKKKLDRLERLVYD